jgi:hypothetical protein
MVLRNVVLTVYYPLKVANTTTPIAEPPAFLIRYATFPRRLMPKRSERNHWSEKNEFHRWD